MPDPEATELADEWRRFSREDLANAGRLLADRADVQPRHVCFAAQQAAEKAIKAVFVAAQREFPFTHDLEQLRDLLDQGHAVRAIDGDLNRLSAWAVRTRYPTVAQPTWEDAEQAFGLAREVVEAAEPS